MTLRHALLSPLLLCAGLTHAASLDQLGWMQGCWLVAGADKGTVEQWTSAEGGSLLGLARTVKAGKTVEFEFLQIRELAPGQLALIAQPSGEPPSTFPLARQDGAAWVFENPAHDFPQRIIYRPDGEHGMFARIEGTIKGKARARDFPMKRISCDAPARV
jgi:hypothetical protein